MSEHDNYLNTLQQLKTNYYESNTKNMLFRKQEKFNCASQIAQNIDMNQAFQRMVVVENDTLFLNYSIFKMVGSPAIYYDLTYHIFGVVEQMLSKYNKIHAVLDLKGLTISAVERYKDFVLMVSDEGIKNGKHFLNYVDKIYFQNPPSFLKQVLGVLLPLLDPVIKDKLVLT
jgi:hypothetical protein